MAAMPVKIFLDVWAYCFDHPTNHSSHEEVRHIGYILEAVAVDEKSQWHPGSDPSHP